MLYSRWADADRMAREASEEAEAAAGQVAALQRRWARRRPRRSKQRRCWPSGARRRPRRATRGGRWRMRWRRRGRGATRWCGGWPSSTGSTCRSPPKARARKRCATMRRGRLPRLTKSVRAIAERLADAEGQAARIAAELTEAEAASRAAEAALAGLLAREAAMRAERRVAEAALAAATAQRDRAEADALKLGGAACIAWAMAATRSRPKRKPSGAARPRRRNWPRPSERSKPPKQGAPPPPIGATRAESALAAARASLVGGARRTRRAGQCAEPFGRRRGAWPS